MAKIFKIIGTRHKIGFTFYCHQRPYFTRTMNIRNHQALACCSFLFFCCNLFPPLFQKGFCLCRVSARFLKRFFALGNRDAREFAEFFNLLYGWLHVPLALSIASFTFCKIYRTELMASSLAGMA